MRIGVDAPETEETCVSCSAGGEEKQEQHLLRKP